MNRQRATSSLWPYGMTAALAAIPIIWLGMVLILMLMRRVADWPDADARTLMTWFTLGVSLLPLLLILFDFAADRRAVVGIKGFSIDFSAIDAQPQARRDSIRLPDNIGLPGGFASDSSPMKILDVLREATGHEVVRLDLGTGHSWWATRLLALAAGAARVGSPRALVFVGRRHNVENAFLGWARPEAVVSALLANKPAYRDAYTRAKGITTQLVAFGHPSLRPPGLAFAVDAMRYINEAGYTVLGEDAFEQVLMDQLAVKRPSPAGPNAPWASLEQPPDEITPPRFSELFQPYIYTDAIDLDWPNDRRVAALLASDADYVAVTRASRYEGMLRRDVAERLILRALTGATQGS